MADEISIKDLREQANALKDLLDETDDTGRQLKLKQQIGLLKLKEDAAILAPLDGLAGVTKTDLTDLKSAIAGARTAIQNIQKRNQMVNKAMAIIATGIKVATKL